MTYNVYDVHYIVFKFLVNFHLSFRIFHFAKERRKTLSIRYELL
jgi:hypothetical protein